MKYSIFNNIVSVSENIDAVYNAFTDKTLFVKKGLFKKMIYCYMRQLCMKYYKKMVLL